MKTRVDRTKCQGYGTCASICGEVFELDEWGFSSVEGEGEVPAALEDDVREAAERCPTGAIVVED